ncbi:hypothetical protein SteCoe_9081 [Stentor coeruleus]|uniref:Uncharacterized protein n=1 Tax=Stentor coeruleus TaxID=5963 RepID=A0A1R2CIP6_9CILI|nr:hypothetical protein SteCoe_9081 [Stentor coeruleus]
MDLPEKRPREEPSKVKMDEKGRLIDEHGREVDLSYSNRIDLDVNKQRFEKKKKKQHKFLQNLKESSKSRGFFFDKNLPKKKSSKKISMGFNFTNTNEEIKLIANVTPDIEWWDKEITNSYSELYNPDAITAEIFNATLPIQLPFNTTTHNVTMHLTEKEKKKIKRLKKAQKLKEIREKIKLGLMEAPPAKIKISSLMRVMSRELAQDPSKTEHEIMEKYNERLQKHIARNEESKLTHAQRVEKALRKRRRDSARESRIAVFKISYFSSTKIKFKLMKNASQLALVGICLILPSPSPSIIIVEGGKRAIKFYTRLCLHRIDWKSDNSSCELVWNTEIKDAKFFKFKILSVESELDLKRILSKKDAMNYWSLVCTWKGNNDMLL